MTPLSSHIVEVVVFPDRARVTRRGAIALEAGLHHIEITDLPLAVQADSLRAAGRGSAAAVLLGVEARKTFYSETPTDTIRELERQIETAAAAGSNRARSTGRGGSPPGICQEPGG